MKLQELFTFRRATLFLRADKVGESTGKVDNFLGKKIYILKLSATTIRATVLSTVSMDLGETTGIPVAQG